MTKIGKYQLVAPLHVTDYSDIMVCSDPQLDVKIVVKLLHLKKSNAADPETLAQWRTRFLHEAKVMARMDHPRLVPIREYAETDEGHPYIVMPFYPATLKYEIGHDGRDPGKAKKLPPSRRAKAIEPLRAVTIFRQVLEGLAALHRFGLVHRDIKPGNILLTAKSDGAVKICDFGMTKVPKLDTDLPGVGMGTQDYASPEQVTDAASVDTRADIFSTGVLAYRMIAGHLPNEVGSELSAVVPPKLRDFARLIDRCRAADVAERPVDAASVLRELDTLAELKL